jgi:hypothetical protein
VRQFPPDAGVHVPSHFVVEAMMHMEPFGHSTSSMQAPPLETLPENVAVHGAGTLGRLKKSASQLRLDSAVRQDAACAGSNWALPSDTAVIAADA